MPLKYGGYAQTPYARKRLITHCRNIRAAAFCPGGKYLFVAAPDPPVRSITDLNQLENKSATNRYKLIR
jgi:hypothetical protein